METDFKVLWSRESKFKFDQIVIYLREQWSEKEVRKFVSQIQNFERIIVRFPEIYKETNKEGLRRAVLSRHNSIFYKIDWDKSLIRVYTIFDNRQHPNKLL